MVPAEWREGAGGGEVASVWGVVMAEVCEAEMAEADMGEGVQVHVRAAVAAMMEVRATVARAAATAVAARAAAVVCTAAATAAAAVTARAVAAGWAAARAAGNLAGHRRMSEGMPLLGVRSPLLYRLEANLSDMPCHPPTQHMSRRRRGSAGRLGIVK